jgi:transcriptional regulator with GAF, ATPase, and Fis domain
LNVFPISVPALRDRSEDIPMLADHFVDCLGKKLNKKVRLTDTDRRMLADHVWPGNVRELQNVIERAIILSNDARLHFDLDRVLDGEISGAPPKALTTNDADIEGHAIRTDAEMRASERENLRAALEQAGGRVSGPGGVADLLGLRPTTVASRLQRLGLK